MTSLSRALPALGARIQVPLSSLVGKPWFWIVFVVLGLTIPIVRTVQIELPKPLPVVHRIPDFQLTDQYGKPYGTSQLQGRVWVANFVFTRCPTICPALTTKMGEVQHRTRNLGEAIHLVSISVDPEHDTPTKLLAYAQANKVSPRIWTFVTGAKDEVRRTVVDGLKVSMTQDGPPDDLMSIGHGAHFVLVDAQMNVRGYYDVTEGDGLDRLIRDAGLLVNLGS